MERLRTVLVGCGGISNAWMGTAARQDLVEIVGVVDLREAAAQALVAKHGLPAGTPTGTDLAAMLARVKPEAVFDLTIPEAHANVTVTALTAGCHVLGEKPMAESMASARRMVAAARASKKTYAVTQTRRWNPNLRRLQRFLESGAIGAVHTVHADFFIAAHFGGFREAMDHVLLLDMAIHSFDQGRLLTPGRPETVMAVEWNPPGSNYRHGASAAACFAFSGDRAFHYRGSWTATGAQTSWECAWRILGDRGAVTWDGANAYTAEVLARDDQPSAEKGGGLIREVRGIPVPETADLATMAKGHDGAIRDFVLAIREGRKPECDSEDNILSLAMVHAAIASAGSGRREAVATGL